MPAPTHWTYAAFDPASDLEQGDILEPRPELLSFLSREAGQFVGEGNVAFVVATQSCDLVVRGSSAPKASHVALAAVHPLTQVLPRLLESSFRAIAPGRFPSRLKEDARRLMHRIFNQNEQALGVFFFHADPAISIGEPSIALLRCTVSVPCASYPLLKEARVGKLDPEFRAKLGWLLGNLYDRPATPDWADKPQGAETLKALVDGYLSEQTTGIGPVWIDDDIIESAKRNRVDLAGASIDELEKLRPKPPHEQAIDEVTRELLKIAGDFDAEKLTKLSNRLANNGRFRNLFRRA